MLYFKSWLTKINDNLRNQKQIQYTAGNVTKALKLVKNRIKHIPESTVKMAAKALSLSPSMTLLECTSSKHMRLKPTTSRIMYNISETSDNHSIPEKCPKSKQEMHNNIN